MTMEEAIGKLVCMLNPYTRDMDIYVGNADPKTVDNDFRQVDLEVDTNYPAEWEFKEQRQRVNTAARIRYRYPVKDKDTGAILYWIDDYMLIGFEGSGGP